VKSPFQSPPTGISPAILSQKSTSAVLS
jgi:hypothetical protein